MKTLILLLGTLLCSALNAQNKIVFAKKDSSKTVTLQQKDFVKLSYNGYMQQQQEAEGYIYAITDSTVILTPKKKFLQKTKLKQTLLIKDINGFTLYSKLRPTGEVIYSFLSIGITGTVTAIISNANVPTELSFVSAVGTQTITTIMKSVFFSSKIKNHLSEEWILQLIK